MANYFYSPLQHTFLVEGVHKEIPVNCVALSAAEHTALMMQQAQGFEIIFDSDLMKPSVRSALQPSEAEHLAALHHDKITEINTACESVITDGFWSSALGEPFKYNSQVLDQLNLAGVVLTGLDCLYACRDQLGVKLFRPHTAAQLRSIWCDLTSFKQELLQKVSDLKQKLDQALANSDLIALEAINWKSTQ